MYTVALDVPANFEQAVSLTPQELTAQIRLMAALKMFELGKLSSGKAATLAGMTRVEFFEMCGRYRVPIFNYKLDEIEPELQLDLEAIAQSKL